MTVVRFEFSFLKDIQQITFDVSGTSSISTDVLIELKINAYGLDAYSRSLNPCSNQYNISQLCPISAGPFAAAGTLPIPDNVMKEIPPIAFRIPDLDGIVTMKLSATDKSDLVCLQAPVGNGKTLASSPIKAFSGAMAVGALLVGSVASIASSVSAAGASIGPLGATGSPSLALSSPNVGDVLMWFQALSLNGAFSVRYPTVLKAFYTNFAWSIGLISWPSMQEDITSFRKLTSESPNVSSTQLVQEAGKSERMDNSGLSSIVLHRRHTLLARDLSIDRRATTNDINTSQDVGTGDIISGIGAFSQQLKIPSQNTFATMLLVFLIVISCVIVFSLLLKIILESWYKSGKLPTKLRGWRTNYWFRVGGFLVRVVLIIFGTWCLFCLYQFRNGDSWAVNLLAGMSLATFSGIICFFTIRITQIAWQAKKHGQNGPEILFRHKPHLRKYGIFYDQFKEKFWWFFVPCIMYSVIKALFIALGDGHGFIQVLGCMICELILLACLFWTRAYDGRQANIVNVMISIVRILSLLGTLLFVEILQIKETNKTIAGIVLIIIQSSLTIILAILIVFNGLLPLFKRKPAPAMQPAGIALRTLESTREATQETATASKSSYRPLSKSSVYSSTEIAENPELNADFQDEHIVCPAPTGPTSYGIPNTETDGDQARLIRHDCGVVSKAYSEGRPIKKEDLSQVLG